MKPSSVGGSDGSGGVQDKPQVDAAGGAEGSSLSTSGPPGTGGAMGKPTGAGGEGPVENDAGSGMSLAPPGGVEWESMARGNLSRQAPVECLGSSAEMLPHRPRRWRTRFGLTTHRFEFSPVSTQPWKAHLLGLAMCG